MAVTLGDSVEIVSPVKTTESTGPSTTGLLLRFALAAVVALAAVAAMTAWLSRRTGLHDAEDQARQLTWIVAKGVVEPALTPEVVAGDLQALDRFDATMRRSVIRGSLIRVKLWDSSGRIVYSDEQRLIGRSFPLDEDELNVLHGARTSTEITDLGAPENVFENPGTELLEVYTAVSDPSGRPMLFESYFAYETVVEAGREAWRRYAPMSLAALGLLQLAQVPIVYQLFRRLRAGQSARESLLRQSVHASSTERRRIAGDLHDGVVQDLTGVSFSLSALARDQSLRPTQVATISSAASSVRTSVHGLRSLLVEIYPPNLEGEGLESALTELVTRLESHGLATQLSVDLPHRPIPIDVTALLYRGALEATRNITTHARASRVSVTVTADHDDVVLTVDDDGTGFDPAKLLEPRSDGHVGMQVLGDISSDYGGSVEIESAPGRGTRVVMRVPIV